MARSVTLNRTAQLTPANPNTAEGFRFDLTATGAGGMPSEIFKLNQRPIDPSSATPLTSDYFGVCTPEDLANLPINKPVAPDTLYRVASMTVRYDTEQEGNNAWTGIKDDVQNLVDALNIQDVLGAPETVVIS